MFSILECCCLVNCERIKLLPHCKAPHTQMNILNPSISVIEHNETSLKRFLNSNPNVLEPELIKRPVRGKKERLSHVHDSDPVAYTIGRRDLLLQLQL